MHHQFYKNWKTFFVHNTSQKKKSLQNLVELRNCMKSNCIASMKQHIQQGRNNYSHETQIRWTQNNVMIGPKPKKKQKNSNLKSNLDKGSWEMSCTLRWKISDNVAVMNSLFYLYFLSYPSIVNAKWVIFQQHKAQSSSRDYKSISLGFWKNDDPVDRSLWG